jgi:hypothetical protein
LIAREQCIRRLYWRSICRLRELIAAKIKLPGSTLLPIQNMAELDEILNKYVEPGTEAQALQGVAFIVKDKDGMLVLTSAFIMCLCLSHSLYVYHHRQYTVLQRFGKAQLRVRITAF